ncbi:MAG: helix-turn-helix transcriptional regulator [Spirochaetes bacterium]|nr:helix-turn-helix transcriptional regulator [Spirochaetota bacterium]
MIDAFLFCTVGSLILGIAANTIVLVLYLKTRNRRLASYLLSCAFLSILVMSLGFHLYYARIGRSPLGLKILIGAIPFDCCGLIVSWPRLLHPATKTALMERTELAFNVSAGLFAAWFAVFRYKPYGGPVVLALFIVMALALLYGSLNVIIRGRNQAGSERLRYFDRALRFSCGLSLSLFPVVLTVDLLRGFIPLVGRVVPRGFHVFPLLYLIMSLVVLIASAMEILEPGFLIAPVAPTERFARKHELTKRETEVIPLLLQCLSYKAIGEKLFISPGTVRTHLVHIYRKTGAATRLELFQALQREQGEAGRDGHASPRSVALP